MMEIRREDGSFAGVFMGQLPPDRRFWRVPVMSQPQWLFTDAPVVPTALDVQTIELERVYWQDGLARDYVLRVRDRDCPQLTNATSVLCVGATCETEWGRFCSFVESVARLRSFVSWHRLDTARSVIQ